jgi:repressor LexA
LKIPLTDRQRLVYEFVCLYMAEYGTPPTRQEIADAFEYKSANAAQQHLNAIVAKGWLTVRQGKARGLQVVGN